MDLSKCLTGYSYIDMTKIFTIGFNGKKPEVFLDFSKLTKTLDIYFFNNPISYEKSRAK